MRGGRTVIGGMSRLVAPPLCSDVPGRFDRPPRTAMLERRLTRRALALWEAGDGGPVSGFDAHGAIIADPGGAAMIECVGSAVAATFGLVAGVRLARGPGLLAEFSALCELVTLHAVPAPFEAGLTSVQGAELMVRGIALPILRGEDAAGAVQIICNWRVVLERSAAARLRRELGSALRAVRSAVAVSDPFGPEINVKLDD